MRSSRNRLRFPAGVPPRFNFSHPIARGMLIPAAFIAPRPATNIDSAPVIDLMTGRRATGFIGVGGIHPIFGPYTSPFDNTNRTEFLVSSNARLSGGPNPVTFGIFFETSSTSFTFLTGIGGGSTGWRVQIDTAVALVANGVSNTGTSFSLSTNTPYFLAMSANENITAVNSVLVNLITGAMQTDKKSPGSATAGSVISTDTYFLGSASSQKVGHGIISNAFHSMDALVKWAMDPWSLWYPNADDLVGVAAASGGFFSRYYYDMPAGNRMTA